MATQPWSEERIERARVLLERFPPPEFTDEQVALVVDTFVTHLRDQAATVSADDVKPRRARQPAQRKRTARRRAA
jgi:hypothetical protein